MQGRNGTSIFNYDNLPLRKDLACLSRDGSAHMAVCKCCMKFIRERDKEGRRGGGRGRNRIWERERAKQREKTNQRKKEPQKERKVKAGFSAPVPFLPCSVDWPVLSVSPAWAWVSEGISGCGGHVVQGHASLDIPLPEDPTFLLFHLHFPDSSAYLSGSTDHKTLQLPWVLGKAGEWQIWNHQGDKSLCGVAQCKSSRAFYGLDFP